MKLYGVEINDPKWIKAYRWIRVSFTLLIVSLFTVLAPLIAGLSLLDPDVISLNISVIIILGPIAWFMSGLFYGALWAHNAEEGKEYLAKLKEKEKEKKIIREIKKHNKRISSTSSETFWFGLGFSKGDFYRFPDD